MWKQVNYYDFESAIKGFESVTGFRADGQEVEKFYSNGKCFAIQTWQVSPYRPTTKHEMFIR
jgi:hypothetical protein